MARYPFQAKDGSTVDLEYPMTEAPDLGVRRVVDGKEYFRVAVIPRFAPHIGKPVDYDRVDSSFTAPTRENARLWGIPDPEDGYNDDGTARFSGRSAKKRYEDRSETEDGKVVFGGDHAERRDKRSC